MWKSLFIFKQEDNSVEHYYFINLGLYILLQWYSLTQLWL